MPMLFWSTSNADIHSLLLWLLQIILLETFNFYVRSIWGLIKLHLTAKTLKCGPFFLWMTSIISSLTLSPYNISSIVKMPILVIFFTIYGWICCVLHYRVSWVWRYACSNIISYNPLWYKIILHHNCNIFILPERMHTTQFVLIFFMVYIIICPIYLLIDYEK